MSLPLYWPGSYYWYPIGNTAPVCLTRDVPPELATSILLLACGDPRHILYTVFCEIQSIGRSLDFTCCDFDPGILARNILLLTMIMDGVSEETTWNIFYHMYLDSESRSTLVSQSQKLTSYASVEEWRSSPYGTTIRMGSNYTLIQLRHHWELYGQLYHSTNSQRLKALQEIMEHKRNTVLRDHTESSINFTASRSSGPLLAAAHETVPLLTNHFEHYWKTGTTITDPSIVAACTHANSTFLYSRAGEGFDVHYGTDPMITFHHAPVLGNANGTLTIGDIVESAKSQFRAWCSAFRAGATTWSDGVLIVRFLLGDALSVSRTLQVWPSNVQAGDRRERTSSSFRLAHWTAHTVELDREEYTTFGAPVRFDVVDSSNLCDDVGIHNVFLCAIPLLANTPTSVLYTESLSTHTADPTTELKLFADLPVVALLLDLAPVDALSGFTTRCNTHELVIARTILSMSAPFSLKQYHQVLTWKRPTSGELSSRPCPSVSIDTLQFAHLLHAIYMHFFEHENPDLRGTLVRGASWCPSRESFVMLLALVLARFPIITSQRSDIVRAFLKILYDNAPTQHPFDMLSHNEIHVQLHRYGLYTEPGLNHVRIPSAGRLSRWPRMPLLVRVYLTVPRDRFAKLKSVSSRFPTPWLHCSIKHPRIEHQRRGITLVLSEHAFQSVDAAYGTVIHNGTEATPKITIAEDHDAPTVIFSFVVPGRLLTQFASDAIYVRIAVRTSQAASAIFTPILGSALDIFTANLDDTNHVHLAPEPSLLPNPFPHTVPTQSDTLHSSTSTVIGTQPSVHVTLDASGQHIASLTARLNIENAKAKACVADNATPHVSRVSPCTMQVALGRLTQALVYPLPIVGSQCKVRIARKSSYIEVVVPIAIPFPQPDGYKLNPFPIVRLDHATAPWSLHRVPLDRLPVLNISPSNTARVGKWYNPHVGSQLSLRESALKIANQRDVDVLANVKDTIHFIMVRGAGVQGATPARVIALRDDVTNDSDSDTIFFVDKFRFDVAAHAVVCDAFVLPLFPALMHTLGSLFERLLSRGVVNVRVYGGEMRAWKRLLPALVERCRSAWTHGANCEYAAAGKIPLELETGEGDPLCSCGRGKDVDGMLRAEDDLWKAFAPFVTRVAISPLFAVSYLEPVFVGRDGQGDSGTPHSRPDESAGGAAAVARCNRCWKEESSAVKLLRCSRCRRTVYCSAACQKSDWKAHKLWCGK